MVAEIAQLYTTGWDAMRVLKVSVFSLICVYGVYRWYSGRDEMARIFKWLDTGFKWYIGLAMVDITIDTASFVTSATTETAKQHAEFNSVVLAWILGMAVLHYMSKGFSKFANWISRQVATWSRS